MTASRRLIAFITDIGLPIVDGFELRRLARLRLLGRQFGQAELRMVEQKFPRT